MAYSPRYLIPCLAWFCFAAACVCLARADEPPARVFRTLGFGGDVAGVFYENRGRRIPVVATEGGVSSAYICPPGDVLSLYRELPASPESAGQTKTRVAEVRLEPGRTAYLVLLAPTTGRPELGAFAVDDSPAAHPAGTVRVLSFRGRRLLARVGDVAGELVRGQSRLFPYAGGDLVWLQIAVAAESGWRPVISGPQVAAPGTRLTVLLRDVPPSSEDPQPQGLIARNILDTVAVAVAVAR